MLPMVVKKGSIIFSISDFLVLFTPTRLHPPFLKLNITLRSKPQIIVFTENCLIHLPISILGAVFNKLWSI